MLKGGIVGFGTSGREFTDYINNHCDRAQIVAACNRGKPNLDVAINEYGLKGTHDLDEMCSWDLDFVMVVSTSYAHCDQVCTAAEAGLAIFCEKPIALNLEDANKMVAAVEKAGVASTVNYSLRYTKRIQALKRFIDEGEIGEVLSFSHEHGRGFGLSVAGAKHRAIQEPEESGGWIVHHMCHQLDLLYYLFGDFKQGYCTTKSTVEGKDSEEVIFATGQMKNGVMFHLSDCLAKVGYDNMTAIGTKSSFQHQRYGQHNVDRVHEENVVQANVFGFENGWFVNKGSKNPAVEHFLDVMEGKAEPMASLKSSYESLKACIAFKEFANSGKVVDLEAYGK